MRILLLKFSIGGLTPSADILRLIEEIHQGNDDQLQSSFQAYDGCSGISDFLLYIGLILVHN
jgi:hypothetical protein